MVVKENKEGKPFDIVQNSSTQAHISSSNVWYGSLAQGIQS